MEKIKIGVRFNEGGDLYAFRCYESVVVGDIVVVDTKYGFKTAEVVDVDFKKDDFALDKLKEVVCKVDFTAFLERKKKAERLKELKGQLDEQFKRMNELAFYDMIAEKNPELKSMVRELKELL